MTHVEMIIDYVTDGSDFQYCDNHGVLTRCRDCKHWREDHTCREHSLVSPMMAYEFCSRAERREVSE